MRLLIIESSGKVKELTKILGEGWKVVASLGHIRDLPDDAMGVEAPMFTPHYVLSERGAEVIAKLRKEVERAEAIYLATDPDREGEAISWHLQQCLQLNGIAKRVTFSKITEAAVKAGISQPRAIDNRLVGAQEARRVLDRLVGYTFSPVLSQLLGEPLSAGRVQTPAVRLVVDRERAIRSFKTTEHFGAQLIFADAKIGEWAAQWIVADFLPEGEEFFLDEAFAQRVAAVQTVAVTAFKEGERRKAPPPPFITATLQQAASVRLGLDPADTMAIAQALYEAGHITYHRTDNPNLTAEDWPEVLKETDRLGVLAVVAQRMFEVPEGAQAGHPAIAPTHWGAESAGSTDQQRAVYSLIRLRALASQLADARYTTRRVELAGEIDGRAVRFKAQSEALAEAGWLRLLDGDDTEEIEPQAPAAQVPALAAGQALDAIGGQVTRQRTHAPKRFTKASLIAKLVSERGGRPATYAAIMENIEARGYITAMGRFLAPTATAERLVDAVAPACAFAQLQFTAALESDLDKIAAGKASYSAVIQSLHRRLSGEVATLQASTTPRHPCPKCGHPLRRIKGSFSTFWGCTAHPACDVKLDDHKGQPVARKAPEPSPYPCPDCGQPLIRRTKPGRQGYDFWGCSGFKDGCRASFPNERNKPALNKRRDAAT